MKTKVKNISDVKVELTISLGAEELKAAEQVALTKLAKEVKIEGFRKGKAPLEMVAAQVDPNLLSQETLENALSKSVAEAFLKEKIQAINRPEVDVKKFVPGTELEFTATSEIMPKVELGDYKNLKVKKEKVSVSQKEINETIDQILKNFAEKKEVKRAAKEGDEVEVKVTFPEEYHAENLKGQEAVFKVKVHEVKTKELPELTDEFAKDVDDSVETLAELKEKFRKELEEAKAAAADEAVADEALRKAVENAEIVELPHEMVHDEVHRQMEHYLNDMRRNGISPEMYYQITGTTEADLHKMMEKDADVRTKTNLVLEQIVKEEGIEATDEDVANEVKELAAQYGMEEDAVRAAVSVDMLKNDISMKKALAVITESAKEA